MMTDEQLAKAKARCAYTDASLRTEVVGRLIARLEAAEAVSEAAHAFRDAIEARDMGLTLPSSMGDGQPGSYLVLLRCLDRALAAWRRSRGVEP